MVWLTSACPLVLDWESLFPEASPDFPMWDRGFLGPLKSLLFLCCSRPAASPSRLCAWRVGRGHDHLSLA